MSAKITVIGKAIDVRQVESPVKKGLNITCFEIETGGSPTTPKGLPHASVIHYTVLVNDRQYAKLRMELEELSLTVKEATLVVHGELNLDLPMDVVQGEIGVIAFHVTVVEAAGGAGRKVPEPAREAGGTPNTGAEPVPVALSRRQITIPEELKRNPPQREQVEKVIAYYKKHLALEEPIKVLKTGNGWLLVDGYTKYMAAGELGLSEVPVIVVNKWLMPFAKTEPRMKTS
ncbi:MAG: ParB/RepB/Spo0J family partition protein [Firmicutes bacterium]|nr:ParB/RepB/Spo0J family partition protein [Bacillota bacterium]